MENALPHKLFSDKIQELLAVLEESINQRLKAATSRRWKAYWDVLQIMLVHAHLTYRLICYTVREDRPENERSIYFTILQSQCFPLLRYMVDTVGTLASLSESPDERMKLFLKSALRDMKRRRDVQATRPMQSKAWRIWLEADNFMLRNIAESAGVDPSTEPKSSWRWPNSGGLTEGGREAIGTHDPNLAAALDYVENWFYRDYSKASHITYAGLLKREAWRISVEKKERGHPERSAQKILTDGTLVMVVLISEAVVRLERVDLKPKCIELWTYLIVASPDAEGLYELRYSRLLAA